MDSPKAHTLQLEDDPKFQQTEWRVARITWVLLLLIMAATGFGLFGGGPLTRATAGTVGGPLWVDYGRATRFGDSFRITIHARADGSGNVRLAVDRELMDAFEVLQVTPDVRMLRATPEAVEYAIATEPSSETTVIFDLQPTRRWRVAGDLRSPAATVRLSLFVFP